MYKTELQAVLNFRRLRSVFLWQCGQLSCTRRLFLCSPCCRDNNDKKKKRNNNKDNSTILCYMKPCPLSSMPHYRSADDRTAHWSEVTHSHMTQMTVLNCDHRCRSLKSDFTIIRRTYYYCRQFPVWTYDIMNCMYLHWWRANDLERLIVRWDHLQL
jgi:hypothetical protein